MQTNARMQMHERSHVKHTHAHVKENKQSEHMHIMQHDSMHESVKVHTQPYTEWSRTQIYLLGDTLARTPPLPYAISPSHTYTQWVRRQTILPPRRSHVCGCQACFHGNLRGQGVNERLLWLCSRHEKKKKTFHLYLHPREHDERRGKTVNFYF